MKFSVMTLFPEMVKNVLDESIMGRAQESGRIEIECVNIRDFSTDKHRKTDDTPYGGGVGMVMTCQPIFDCYESIRSRIPEGNKTRAIYMSPKGRQFSHQVAKELAEYDNLIFLCGHYEGVDQRVIDALVDDEISIGDYVVTGGEIPACIVIDATSRLLDGVLSSSECYEGESVASGILEYPQYTKPRVFRDMEVPPILLSGDHKKIDLWRLAEAIKITEERRPDLIAQHPEVYEPLLPKPKKRRSHSVRPKKTEEKVEE
jgi:tRNA (guanine37-N1)-methyltransferase